jgi:hypothetical protein
VSVRSHAALIGLDKIRKPIAHRAALKATGFPMTVDGCPLPVEAGQPYAETQLVVDEAYKAAVKAAQEALA